MLQNVSASSSLILRRAFERSFGSSHPLQYSAKELYFGQLTGRHAKTIEHDSRSSPADYEIRYKDGSTRAFEHFDFLREWNNRGDGNIGFGSGVFDISHFQLVKGSSFEPWGEVYDCRTDLKVSDYLGIFRTADKLTLWCLRDCGPVDGFDWSFVEEFVSQLEVDRFGGSPVIREVPAGFQAGVFMRIDCDEAISSGRPLFELYRKKDMPFSMAIKTEQNISHSDLQLMNDTLEAGGSVVTHSHTHASDWGRHERGAKFELEKSHEIMRSWKLRGINFEFAVSPFHQNSLMSLKALSNAGLRGFIGGIACNDPESLVYRAGVAATEEPMVTISTQCMLHGDCYHQQGNRLDTETKALKSAISKKKLFGYLDHPLSDYNYGWSSEEERLSAHSTFIDEIQSFKKLWLPNLVDALKFTRKKSQLQVERRANGDWKANPPPSVGGNLSLELAYNSQTFTVPI